MREHHYALPSIKMRNSLRSRARETRDFGLMSIVQRMAHRLIGALRTNGPERRNGSTLWRCERKSRPPRSFDFGAYDIPGAPQRRLRNPRRRGTGWRTAWSGYERGAVERCQFTAVAPQQQQEVNSVRAFG